MAVKQFMTAEQFLVMPDASDRWLELVAGELIERSLFGFMVACVSANLFHALYSHVKASGLGEVFTSGLGYILRRDPDTVRTATVSFVAEQHIPHELPEGFWPGAPDIAVEIMLPDQPTNDTHARIRDFIEAGTRIVWELWPDDRTVRVYANGMTHELGEHDQLDGGDALPGFTVRVGDLFAMPTRP